MADALDDIAGELYVLPPGEFTAARNERAGAASGALAKQVKALRKPSVAAWAVNLLTADGQLAEAVELSHALHEAQDDLDAPELAKLGRQRRALVAGLARRAADLAADSGTTLSTAVRDEVEKTVNAAILDADTAAAVLTGRLVRTIGAGGAGAGADADDTAGAVAGSVPGLPARPAPTRDDLAERRARKAAEAAARDAARAASDAERERARLQARLDKARERADHLRERAAELRADLAKVEADADDADEKVDALEDEHSAAADLVRTATADAERARKAVEDR